MKAKFKKIVAALLSAMMVLTMCVTTNVHAAEADTAQLTIKQPENFEEDTLNGRTFNAYQLFNATRELVPDTDQFVYEYSDVTQNQTAAVVKVINDSVTKFNKEYPDSIIKTSLKNEATAAEVVNFLNKTVKSNQDFLKIFAKEFKNQVESLGEAIKLEGPNFSGNVKYGYYVILEDVSNIENQKYMASAPILYTVVESNVDITVKADMPKVTKKISDANGAHVDNNDYSIGDDVTFVLNGTVPTTGVLVQYKTYKYEFVDTFSAGLNAPEFNTFQIKVGNKEFIVDQEGNIIEKPQTKATDNGIGNVKISGQQMTITFNDLIPYLNNLGPESNIVVTYKAKLNDKAKLGNVTDNNNKVHINYSNNPYGDGMGTTIDDVVHVYTTGLNIAKKDGVTKEALHGAQFELRKEKSESSTDSYYVTGSDGAYKLDKSLSTGTQTLEVNTSGVLTIDGLGAGTYYLYETKAPEGYNKLKDPIEIVVTANYTNSESEKKTAFNEFTYTIDNGQSVKAGEDGRLSVEVKNFSGAQLPSTGGMGTTILYLAGILAMAGGVCYFVMEKRKKAQVK